MSFITGLTDDLKTAWNGTVNAVGSAAGAVGNAVNNTWEWLTGNKSPPQPPVGPNADSKVPVDDPEANSVAKPEAVKDQGPWYDYSLTHLLNLLRIEAMYQCEIRTKVPYEKAIKAHDKSTQLNKLLGVINTQSDKKGNFTVASDAATKDLMEKAKSFGVEIDLTKETYTKEDRDGLITNIKTTSNSIDVDLRMGMTEAGEAVQQRNTFWQELKSCWDKLSEAIRKFIQAISAR